MKKIYDNVSDPRQILFQAVNTCLLTESRLEDVSKKLRHIAQIGNVHIDRGEGSTCDIEFVA
jgi:hypothetical protein